MATFTLSTGNDTLTGTAAADTFSGDGGGVDTLRGLDGDDTFAIQWNQAGLIDGGLGFDRITMTGHNNNSFDLGLKIVGVENFTTDNTNTYGTAAQFSAFSSITSTAESDEFHIFLQGEGGTLNLSKSFTGPQQLNIEAEMTNSAVRLTGSNGSNQIIGSDFNDRISGAGGKDTIYGGAGDDLVNGGTGKDTLYGDDGADSFFFNSTVKNANVDHIGDFRPDDDTIRLENSVFKGLAAGELSDELFKDLGLGEQDADDRILYDSETGHLYFDKDGLGDGAPKLFAIVDNFSGDVPTVTASDFLIV